MQFLDEPVTVVASIDSQGHTIPTQLNWGKIKFSLVTVGRQWDEDSGRHILVEASDGTRFELQLSRSDLCWRLKRQWPLEMAA
jgi:hypothetical protein